MSWQRLIAFPRSLAMDEALRRHVKLNDTSIFGRRDEGGRVLPSAALPSSLRIDSRRPARTRKRLPLPRSPRNSEVAGIRPSPFALFQGRRNFPSSFTGRRRTLAPRRRRVLGWAELHGTRHLRHARSLDEERSQPLKRPPDVGEVGNAAALQAVLQGGGARGIPAHTRSLPLESGNSEMGRY